jgi:hypothetical protein
VTALIKPAITAEQVSTFLLDHIRHDIQVLGRAINKSPDDCLSLMTMLIGTFMNNKKCKKLTVWAVAPSCHLPVWISLKQPQVARHLTS